MCCASFALTEYFTPVAENSTFAREGAPSVKVKDRKGKSEYLHFFCCGGEHSATVGTACLDEGWGRALPQLGRAHFFEEGHAGGKAKSLRTQCGAALLQRLLADSEAIVAR